MIIILIPHQDTALPEPKKNSAVVVMAQLSIVRMVRHIEELPVKVWPGYFLGKMVSTPHTQNASQSGDYGECILHANQVYLHLLEDECGDPIMSVQSAAPKVQLESVSSQQKHARISDLECDATETHSYKAQRLQAILRHQNPLKQLAARHSSPPSSPLRHSVLAPTISDSSNGSFQQSEEKVKLNLQSGSYQSVDQSSNFLDEELSFGHQTELKDSSQIIEKLNEVSLKNLSSQNHFQPHFAKDYPLKRSPLKIEVTNVDDEREVITPEPNVKEARPKQQKSQQARVVPGVYSLTNIKGLKAGLLHQEIQKQHPDLFVCLYNPDEFGEDGMAPQEDDQHYHDLRSQMLNSLTKLGSVCFEDEDQAHSTNSRGSSSSVGGHYFADVMK